MVRKPPPSDAIAQTRGDLDLEASAGASRTWLDLPTNDARTQAALALGFGLRATPDLALSLRGTVDIGEGPTTTTALGVHARYDRGRYFAGAGPAIAHIRAGRTCHEVDEVARTVIGKAGFGRAFGHGLGHGIGLEIHEAPRLAAGDHRKLEAGMIVTVEPGIYLPGFGGVRIEDDVLVTKDGCQVLTSVAKSWEDAIVA